MTNNNFAECEAGYTCAGGDDSEVKTECLPGGYCEAGNQ